MSYVCEWCNAPVTLVVRPVDTRPSFTDSRDVALACEVHAAYVLEPPAPAEPHSL